MLLLLPKARVPKARVAENLIFYENIAYIYAHFCYYRSPRDTVSRDITE